jgi:hypothetical protein
MQCGGRRVNQGRLTEGEGSVQLFCKKRKIYFSALKVPEVGLLNIYIPTYAAQSVTKIISFAHENLVTPKVGA